MTKAVRNHEAFHTVRDRDGDTGAQHLQGIIDGPSDALACDLDILHRSAFNDLGALAFPRELDQATFAWLEKKRPVHGPIPCGWSIVHLHEPFVAKDHEALCMADEGHEFLGLKT